MTEFTLSSIILLVSIIATIVYIYKFRFDNKLWTLSILVFMSLSLISNLSNHLVNILFCLFNRDYWMYALETYFCNLYYLVLVAYICKAYLLKQRSAYSQGLNGEYKLLEENVTIEQKNR